MGAPWSCFAGSTAGAASVLEQDDNTLVVDDAA
jgi:hypothetical protein